jgi:hypothetical protein
MAMTAPTHVVVSSEQRVVQRNTPPDGGSGSARCRAQDVNGDDALEARVERAASAALQPTPMWPGLLAWPVLY